MSTPSAGEVQRARIQQILLEAFHPGPDSQQQQQALVEQLLAGLMRIAASSPGPPPPRYRAIGRSAARTELEQLAMLAEAAMAAPGVVERASAIAALEGYIASLHCTTRNLLADFGIVSADLDVAPRARTAPELELLVIGARRARGLVSQIPVRPNVETTPKESLDPNRRPDRYQKAYIARLHRELDALLASGVAATDPRVGPIAAELEQLEFQAPPQRRRAPALKPANMRANAAAALLAGYWRLHLGGTEPGYSTGGSGRRRGPFVGLVRDIFAALEIAADAGYHAREAVRAVKRRTDPVPH